MKRRFSLSKDLEEGISSTISTAQNNIGQLRYEVVPLSRIKLDPENPRKLTINPTNLLDAAVESDPLYEQKKKEMETLQSMAHSIKKVGVRHAIEVYKDGSDYNLISGERRVLASMLAGKEEIQARILERKPTDLDLKLLQWIENIEREDLSPWERVNNVKQLISAYTKTKEEKVTTTALAEILGCSRQHAATLLAILDAPPLIADALQKGTINNLEKAALLSRIKDSDLRTKLLDACVKGISLNELKKLSEKKNINKHTNKFKQGQGRPVARVNLGHTTNLLSVKRLINSVLLLEDYSVYKDHFNSINWNNYAEVAHAFKILLHIMEKKENKVL